MFKVYNKGTRTTTLASLEIVVSECHSTMLNVINDSTMCEVLKAKSKKFSGWDIL